MQFGYSMQACFEMLPRPSHQSFLLREFVPAKFCMPLHFHPEYELLLIRRGRGTRIVGDNIEAYTEGDLVLLGPNVPHVWRLDRAIPEGHMIVLQFAEDILGGDFLSIPEMMAVARLLQESRRGIQFPGLAGIAAGLRQLSQLEGPARMAQFIQILGMLANAKGRRLLASPGYLPGVSGHDAARLEKILRYVIAHMTEPIWRPKVAAEMHMTDTSFSRFFRQKAGRTFSQFVNEVRVNRAATLLIEAKMNVTEIALSCGFFTLSNFNRQFQKLKGCSPREFARHYTRENVRTGRYLWAGQVLPSPDWLMNRNLILADCRDEGDAWRWQQETSSHANGNANGVPPDRSERGRQAPQDSTALGEELNLPRVPSVRVEGLGTQALAVRRRGRP